MLVDTRARDGGFGEWMACMLSEIDRSEGEQTFHREVSQAAEVAEAEARCLEEEDSKVVGFWGVKAAFVLAQTTPLPRLQELRARADYPLERFEVRHERLLRGELLDDVLCISQ